MQISKSKPSELQLKQWITKQIEHRLLQVQSPVFWADLHAQIPGRFRPFIGMLYPLLRAEFIAKNLNYALDWLQPVLIRHHFRITHLSLSEVQFEVTIDPSREQKPSTSTFAIGFEAALKSFFEQHLFHSGYQFEISSFRFFPAIKLQPRNKQPAKLTFQISLAEDEWDRFFLKTQLGEITELQLKAFFWLEQETTKTVSSKSSQTAAAYIQKGTLDLEISVNLPNAALPHKRSHETNESHTNESSNTAKSERERSK